VARKLTGPAILTRAEAAQALGVHPSTVARRAATGVLPSFRTPSGERYRRCDVEALLNRRGLADGALSSEPVYEPIELIDQDRLLGLPRQAALSPSSLSDEDHICRHVRPARAAG
jgi:excisionase family DNA binding protein